MADPLSPETIKQALQDLSGWSYANDMISKEFEFTDFVAALAFINRVGEQAEAQGHHPEIFNVYNRVTLSLNTHDAGGKVTQKDLDLASSVQGLA